MLEPLYCETSCGDVVFNDNVDGMFFRRVDGELHMIPTFRYTRIVEPEEVRGAPGAAHTLLAEFLINGVVVPRVSPREDEPAW